MLSNSVLIISGHEPSKKFMASIIEIKCGGLWNLSGVIIRIVMS